LEASNRGSGLGEALKTGYGLSPMRARVALLWGAWRNIDIGRLVGTSLGTIHPESTGSSGAAFPQAAERVEVLVVEELAKWLWGGCGEG